MTTGLLNAAHPPIDRVVPLRALRLAWLTDYKLSIVLHFAVVFLLSVIMFQYNYDFLFLGFDGSYFKVLIRHQEMWAPSGMQFANTPLQGLGNVMFPLNFNVVAAYLGSAKK